MQHWREFSFLLYVGATYLIVYKFGGTTTSVHKTFRSAYGASAGVSSLSALPFRRGIGRDREKFPFGSPAKFNVHLRRQSLRGSAERRRHLRGEVASCRNILLRSVRLRACFRSTSVSPPNSPPVPPRTKQQQRPV